MFQLGHRPIQQTRVQVTLSPVPFTEKLSQGVDMSLYVRLVVPFFSVYRACHEMYTYFPSRTGFRHLKNVFPGGILRRVGMYEIWYVS